MCRIKWENTVGFSGYFQLLCERGHYSEVDCYTYEVCLDTHVCSHCESPIVWEHSINTTNDCGDDQQVELEEIAPQIIDVCDECGHETIVEPARYKIPEVSDDG